MNLQLHRELDSLIEPAGARPAPAVRPFSASNVLAKSLVKINVASIISIILLIGNSG